jgi:hypothetical protein
MLATGGGIHVMRPCNDAIQVVRGDERSFAPAALRMTGQGVHDDLLFFSFSLLTKCHGVSS